MSEFDISQHVIPAQHIREYPGATLFQQEAILKLHVKQYKPKLAKKSNGHASITIIAAHANAFPKELYEPLWDDLYHALAQSGIDIRSIWIADVAQQGGSGVINSQHLGNDPSWNDHARDLLHMINHFREEMPRPMIGIGHSMGGCQIAHLALLHPRLFQNIILIDPVIHTRPPSTASMLASTHLEMQSPHVEAARRSTFRRDSWPSRNAAREYFARSPFYQAWDPRVFELWLKHGLQDTRENEAGQPGPGDENRISRSNSVRLVTSRDQEVFTFLRPNWNQDLASFTTATKEQRRTTLRRLPDLYPDVPATSGFHRPEPAALFDALPHLRPSVLFVFGGKSPIHSEEARKIILRQTGTGLGGKRGTRLDMVQEAFIPDGGHLMPMEQPGEVAKRCAGPIILQKEQWCQQEEEWKREWLAKSIEDRTKITSEWKQQIGRPVRKRASRL